MDYLGQEMSRSLDLVQCMQPTCLIQDLNITCPGCKYPIPPWEVSLVAPRTVLCPKCKLAFSPPDANL